MVAVFVIEAREGLVTNNSFIVARRRDWSRIADELLQVFAIHLAFSTPARHRFAICLRHSIPDGLRAGAIRPGLYSRTREARAGIEPAHRGFADRCVTTSPPGQCPDDTNFLEVRLVVHRYQVESRCGGGAGVREFLNTLRTIHVAARERRVPHELSLQGRH